MPWPFGSPARSSSTGPTPRRPRVRNAAGRARSNALGDPGGRPLQERAPITTPRAPTSTSRAAGSCSTSAATTTSAWPTTWRSSRPRTTTRSTAGATGWPRSASSAAPALHRELEERLAAFLGTDDTILFSSCFDANGGLFRRCSARRTPSSPTSSTTPRSSTGSGSARPSGCATRTATWTSSRRGWRSPRAPAAG